MIMDWYQYVSIYEQAKEFLDDVVIYKSQIYKYYYYDEHSQSITPF
jgi:hypothetical protein